jgi:tetraacyldisaccharide 4'-kinase
LELAARMPGVPHLQNPDRIAAAEEALAANPRHVLILDDAFQHRRLVPTQSIVLLSAEQLQRPRRMLPAGPWREPLAAARRADLIIITRKSASSVSADESRAALRAMLPRAPIATVHLAPDALRSATDDGTLPLEHLRGRDVLAIAAIGEPDLFGRQLDQLGARVHLVKFRDHHAFSAEDIRTLALSVRADGLAVCTLKDAVKLGPRWLGDSRLWYVSQRLVVEQGADEIDRVLTRVLEARAPITTSAG